MINSLVMYSQSVYLYMFPPPPRSTLFPYTTLFRSHRVVVARGDAAVEELDDLAGTCADRSAHEDPVDRLPRRGQWGQAGADLLRETAGHHRVRHRRVPSESGERVDEAAVAERPARRADVVDVHGEQTRTIACQLGQPLDDRACLRGPLVDAAVLLLAVSGPGQVGRAEQHRAGSAGQPDPEQPGIRGEDPDVVSTVLEMLEHVPAPPQAAL